MNYCWVSVARCTCGSPCVAIETCSMLGAVGYRCSVDFFHRRAAGAARCAASAAKAAAWHAALRHAAAASCCLVHLHHDRIDDTLKLLLLGLKFVLLGQLVLVQPVKCLLHGFFNFLFVAALKFVLQLFLVQRVPHCEAVVLQAVFGLD